MNGHVVTLEPMPDPRDRRVHPWCDRCGRLTLPCWVRPAHLIAAEHVRWTAANPAAAQALTDDRAALVDATGVLRGSDAWDWMLRYRTPPLYADVVPRQRRRGA